MVDFHQQQAAWMDRMPEAPTFFPTREQFEDPLAYIRSIQQEAAQYGADVYIQHQKQDIA
jgi:jmjN domain